MNKYSPDYYKLGKIEVWDFILDQGLDYLSGNVIKYLCRAGSKTIDPFEDLVKAQAYLRKLISQHCNDDSTESPETGSPVSENNGPTEWRIYYGGNEDTISFDR